MLYRKFGKDGTELSALGLGCMRFPLGGDGKVDLEQTEAMINHAIEQGVNYLDTAYPYHEGESESIVGNILTAEQRKRVKLVTKLPSWEIKSYADFDRFLDLQLDRLKTDYIDYYLLHSLMDAFWPNLTKLDVFKWLDKVKSEGRIKGAGFSFHGDLPLFKKIVDSYGWDICMIQYNFMNENEQAGTEGLEYAYARDIPVVVMEPLLGGMLANPPTEVEKIWKESGHSPVELALKWLLNKKEVALVISGMSSLGQLKENLGYASTFAAGSLTPAEAEVIEQVRTKYGEYDTVTCTKCRYCMPCPQGVDIPRNFSLYNDLVTYQNFKNTNISYTLYVADTDKASACTSCGLCEPKCPQSIKIASLMPRIHRALTIQP